jgi:NAD(P)-dependent dehydrogenase (short-subunit alcohol dehydrogenase family)
MSDAGSFQGRTVVVTGGAGALGSAVVAAILEAGGRVRVPELAPVDHPSLAGWPLRDRVDLVGGVNLTDEAAVTRFYESGDVPWASIHVAGGFAFSPLADTTLGAFHAMIEINATTTFLCCREAVRRMRVGGQGGRIVNVAARPALVPTANLGAYSAAKAAVAALTLSLAEELASEEIWVNAVAPSIFDTPANRAAMPDADHAAWPSPGEVAGTIVFLASPLNRVTRGGIVPVYGKV